MKKIIILIAFLVSAGHIFGQDIVKIEDYPTTTTTTNSNYVTVYTETPTKAARKIYADYAFPMIYSPGLVRPRSMGANMVIGSTTNPYADKLYVNGNLRASGTGHFTTTLQLGNPSFYTAIYQHPITGELIFNDPVNGVHTMSEFLAAGSSSGSTVFDSISTTYIPRIYTNNWNFGGEVPSTYKVTVTGSLRSTGETHFGAVNYDTYIYGNAKIQSASGALLIGETNRYGLGSGPGGMRVYDGNTVGRYLYLKPTTTTVDIFDTDGNGLQMVNSTADYLSFIANSTPYYFNGTYFYNGTDTLATRAYARGYGGSEGGGGTSDVWETSNDTTYLIENDNIISLINGTSKSKLYISNTSSSNGVHVANVSTGRGLSVNNSSTGSGQRITNTGLGTGIWVDNDEGTGIKIQSNSDGDVLISVSGLFNVDTTFRVTSTGKVRLSDSLILKMFEGETAGSLWFTNTPTGALDSAHTEPAYIGWEMEDLPTLEEYEKDVKMINGHMERRVWYIDYETKELKSQYGWDGLGMMNTQSAYMIYHEITVRWMFEQNKKLAELERRSNEENKAPLWRTIASIIIFIMFMILLTKQHIRLTEIESERINNRR